ncbi:hypothetical protein [Endozoicomonas sp. SESOKO3]|uniref:hypothetical protein n=1 Tax=Endozoicomonas sp. SESOKO3 TaxID=2828744 RepID=UPI0021492651|nr:hypothetical protein [Endozoicomonas sp. SESOKO3]
MALFRYALWRLDDWVVKVHCQSGKGYLGRSAILPQATSVVRHCDGAAEFRRSRSSFVTSS